MVIIYIQSLQEFLDYKSQNESEVQKIRKKALN